jgi:hypothetical protein
MPTTSIPTENSRFFLFGADSQPARQRTPNCFPEVLRGGQWVPLNDLWTWMHEAQEVDEVEWQARVDEVTKPSGPAMP